MLAFFALFAAQTSRPIVTPYARQGALAIRAVRMPPSVPRYGIEEIAVDLDATYDNPFDPRDVTLDAEVRSPSGKRFVVPGFVYRPYRRELANGQEVLSPTGDPEWRVRVAPLEVGAYTLDLVLRDRTGTTRRAASFQATQAAEPGFVRISDEDPRRFEFDDGTSYYPIGANVAWAGPRGTYDYDDWFPAYGAVGANYARLWLSPQWFTFALEKAGKPAEGKGMGQFDLGNAWRIDEVLGKAHAAGLYLMLTIDSYNILRDRDGFPEWEKAPQNRENGGPLRIWSDFWTNPEMDRLYRAKLRYLVARYGANAHVLSWEFWNEVDLTRDYDPAVVRDWHQRMGRELKRIDPYRHLVTTSVANSMGDKALDLLPEIDYVQTHNYNSPDPAAAVVFQQSRKAGWGKPHMVGEIGADAAGPRADEDPTGIQIHDPIWASIATGASGAAAPWWWDSLIAPKNLYPLFGAAAKFVKGIDWPREAFRQSDLTLAFAGRKPPRAFRDLELSGPAAWTASPENRPATVRVSPNGGVSGALPLAGIQHGTVNHPDLRNPVTFQVNLPRPTRFEVLVGDVSGYGGATLAVSLDGKRVMTRDFPDRDEKGTANMTQYAGAYGFVVPKGRHTIRVENTGKDWFMVGYRFAGLVLTTKPPLDAWGIVGNDAALAWARVKGRTWRNLVVLKRTPAPAPPSVVGFSGLRAGLWRAELWDTWKGVVARATTIRVGNSGHARVPLPAISTDLAIKLVRVGAR